MDKCFFSPELSLNGELSSEAPGFSKIFLHLKEEQHIEFDGSTIVVRDKLSVTQQSGDEPLTVGRCCILLFPHWTCYKRVNRLLTSSRSDGPVVCTDPYFSSSSSAFLILLRT